MFVAGLVGNMCCLSCRNGPFDHFWVISTRFGLIIPFLKIGSPNIGGTLVEEIT